MRSFFRKRYCGCQPKPSRSCASREVWIGLRGGGELGRDREGASEGEGGRERGNSKGLTLTQMQHHQSTFARRDSHQLPPVMMTTLPCCEGMSTTAKGFFSAPHHHELLPVSAPPALGRVPVWLLSHPVPGRSRLANTENCARLSTKDRHVVLCPSAIFSGSVLPSSFCTAPRAAGVHSRFTQCAWPAQTSFTPCSFLCAPTDTSS